MTVSDWGSAAAPHGASGFRQSLAGATPAAGTQVQDDRRRSVNATAIHPAHAGHHGGQHAGQHAGHHGGPEPHNARQMSAEQMYAQQMYAQTGRMPASGGYLPHDDEAATFGAPEPYAGHRATPHAAPRVDAHAPQSQATRSGGRQTANTRSDRPRNGGPQGGSAALNVIGALVSVALMVGLGVWGYKLAVRDVTGVPVVKALEGPMRIQPEDPGGVVTAHQGLSVNDVPADGVSAAPVDSLKLAPPVAELSEEDVPAHPQVEVTAAPQRPATAPLHPETGAQTATGIGTGTGTGAESATEQAAAPEATAAPLPSNGGDINADAAVAEALGLTDIPGLGAPDFGTSGAAPTAAAPTEVIPESVPGVSRSPRPMPRPARFGALPEISAPINAVDVAAAADSPAPARPTETAAPAVALGYEIEPAEVTPDARLVQLGAYPSIEDAREGWKKIAALNPEMFQGRNWTIERHEAGGSPFFRLRALGFAGLDEARAFCAALIAAQGSCVPVIDPTASAQVAAN